MNKNILITGASGWLGLNLINAFLNGIDLYPETQNLDNEVEITVFVPKNEERKLKENFGNKINYYFGDITNKLDCERFLNQFDKFDLFHLAGIIHPSKINKLFEINFQGTKNILSNCNSNNCNKFIYISSNSPFGVNHNRAKPFDESSSYRPYLNYGKSKQKAEEAVKKFCARSNVKYFIIRPTWFYGPFHPERQNLFFKMIISGKVPIVGNGSNLRSMTNTENLSYALILIWKNTKIQNEIFWIADENPYEYIYIINTVREILSKNFNKKITYKSLNLPNISSKIAYFVDYVLQKLNLYNSKIHVLSELNKDIFCSSSKAYKVLGYKPKINLHNGLIRNFEWMYKKINKNG